MLVVVAVSDRSEARCKRASMGKAVTGAQSAISHDSKVVTMVSEAGAVWVMVYISPIAPVVEPGSV